MCTKALALHFGDILDFFYKDRDETVTCHWALGGTCQICHFSVHSVTRLDRVVEICISLWGADLISISGWYCLSPDMRWITLTANLRAQVHIKSAVCACETRVVLCFIVNKHSHRSFSPANRNQLMLEYHEYPGICEI